MSDDRKPNDPDLESRIRENCNSCPNCGSEETQQTDTGGCAHEFTVTRTCVACGAEWFEGYELVRAWTREDESQWMRRHGHAREVP